MHAFIDVFYADEPFILVNLMLTASQRNNVMQRSHALDTTSIDERLVLCSAQKCLIPVEPSSFTVSFALINGLSFVGAQRALTELFS